MNYIWKLFGFGGFDKFFDAISNGNLADVKYYYKKDYINKRNVKGLRPLHQACLGNNTDIIQFLIENKCNIEEFDNGDPPFHIAYKNGNMDVVRFLLKEKYGTESCDMFGMRPIHWACLKGQGEILKLLIAYGCQLDSLTTIGTSPVDIAEQYMNQDCVNLVKTAIQLMPFIKENIQIEIKRAIRKNEKTNKKICAICLDKEINCVLNCGHAFCLDCGRQFVECPNCRSKPTFPKRLYLD